MNTKTTIAISEARRLLFDIADKVQRPGQYYTFTDKGRPKAVLMSATEFESWAETLEVMQDFPNLKKDIAAAERNYKKGDFITLDQFLAQGLPVKPSYDIHSRSSKKRTKGSR